MRGRSRGQAVGQLEPRQLEKGVKKRGKAKGEVSVGTVGLFSVFTIAGEEVVNHMCVYVRFFRIQPHSSLPYGCDAPKPMTRNGGSLISVMGYVTTKPSEHASRGLLAAVSHLIHIIMFLPCLPAALTERPARTDLGGIGLLPSDSDRRYFMHRFNGSLLSGGVTGRPGRRSSSTLS
ncbi:hypothetical protein E2C01_036208 [Portunus trituberculatus]|uniref:Uncharacterized protein n=1 Tax=Portunus trituberculatus TaxID=210409 RepID=A0A5B7FAQ6_PORTR|nr:hypothetical protein [Portunus trituberculatus]